MPKKAWLALWLIIFAVALAWRVQNLDAFGFSNDEGVYLMWGKLAADGYPLYSQIYAVQPPLFFESLALAFKLAGETIQTGRWAMLLGFSLLSVTLSWLAYKTGRWAAAITALVLTAISPLIFSYSRLAMAEVPATALAVTSVALLVLFTGKGNHWLLAASGLVLGASFIFKTLNPFVVVPAGVLLILYHTPAQFSSFKIGVFFTQLISTRKQWRPLLIDGFLWGGCAVLPVAAIFLIYDTASVYDQVVAFRNDLRAAIPGSWPETRSHFELFFGTHWGFWLLAIAGIISTLWRIKVQAGSIENVDSQAYRPSTTVIPAFALYNFIWAIWLLAGVAMLLWHTPLFAHHFIVLLPPLILLAAGLISNTVALWPEERSIAGYSAALCLVIIIVIAALNLPAMVKANQDTASIVTGGREQDALKLLQAVSHPDDFLVGDSQLLIFMADRRTPPPLGDLALVGIKAGRQTSERLVSLTEEYQSPAVVRWSLRLPWLPEYIDWVEQNYLARKVWDDDHIIHFVRRTPTGEEIPNAQQTRLGDSVMLEGYLVNSKPLDTLDVKLYWQVGRPVSENYTVFTQLLDSSGARVAGVDSQPLGGYFPTSQWPENEIITDVVSLSLPKELPAGRYTLITGMYLLETLERLPVETGGDFVTLTTIEIE